MTELPVNPDEPTADDDLAAGELEDDRREANEDAETPEQGDTYEGEDEGDKGSDEEDVEGDA
jgi:hypothetical protein